MRKRVAILGLILTIPFFQNCSPFGNNDSAEQSGEMTAREHDMAGPEAESLDAYAASGSLMKALPGEELANYTVSTATGLADAMRKATGGQVIEVQPGTYSAISITTALRKSPNVIIRAADRARPPILRGLSFLRTAPSSGFTLDGLHFLSNQYQNGSWPGGRGLAIEITENFTIRNCIFDGFHEGVLANRAKGLLMEWNEFRNIGMDSIRLYDGVENVRIRNNNFHTPKVNTARSHEYGRHPDFIQLASNYNKGANNVVIENNRFVTFNGYHQVMFIMAEKAVRGSKTIPAADYELYSHRAIVVRGNYIESAHASAIVLAGVKGALIENNLIRQLSPHNWDRYVTIPRIMIAGRNSGTIRNNIWPYVSRTYVEGYELYSSGGGPVGSLSGFTRTNNELSSTESPDNWRQPLVGPYGYN